MVLVTTYDQKPTSLKNWNCLTGVKERLGSGLKLGRNKGLFFDPGWRLLLKKKFFSELTPQDF